MKRFTVQVADEIGERIEAEAAAQYTRPPSILRQILHSHYSPVQIPDSLKKTSPDASSRERDPLAKPTRKHSAARE